MARTTVNIDTPLLKDLRKLQKEQKKSLSRLISDLLGQALAQHRSSRQPVPSWRWKSQRMKPLVDITDKEALYAAMDGSRE